MIIETNYLVLLVVAIANMILGMLWYGPLMFGKFWMRYNGVADKDGNMLISKEEFKKKQKEAGPLYFVQFLLSLVTAYVLFMYVKYIPGDNYGLGTAFSLWLGFIMPMAAAGVIWSNIESNQMRLKVFLVTSVYQLISIILSAYIIWVW